MKVSPQLKGRDHALAVSHVSQQTQLKLAIVSNNQRLVRLSTERLANLQGQDSNKTPKQTTSEDVLPGWPTLPHGMES